MDEYLNLAREDIKAEAEWTMNRLRDIANDHCIERFWLHEEFLKELRKRMKEADNE